MLLFRKAQIAVLAQLLEHQFHKQAPNKIRSSAACSAGSSPVYRSKKRMMVTSQEVAIILLK